MQYLSGFLQVRTLNYRQQYDREYELHKHIFLLIQLELFFFRHPVMLDCKHVYCFECLHKMMDHVDGFDTQWVCPYCRHPIQEEQLRQVFKLALICHVIQITISPAAESCHNKLKTFLSNLKRPKEILDLMDKSSLGTTNLTPSESAKIQNNKNEEFWQDPSEKIIIAPSIRRDHSIFDHLLNCLFFIFR